jgi:cyanophycinase
MAFNMTRKISPVALASFIGLLLAFGWLNRAHSQFDSNYPEPLPPLEGTLFLHGGGIVDSEMRARFTELAGGKDAKIIVIPTADVNDPMSDKKLEVWREHQPKSLEFLHAETRDEIASSNFEAMLANATAVWFSGGKQSKLIERYSGSVVEEGIMKLLSRGGVVGGSSAGAAVASKVMLVFDEHRTGFDLLPGTIVDQHFTQRKRDDRLRRAVEAHPDRVGFGIDERTALVVRGRRLSVIGEGNVFALIAANADRPARTEVLESGSRADLISLRRSAQARTAKVFPSKQAIATKLDRGSLLIAGGGGLPEEAIQEFVRLAGGSEARIVYIPCEEAKIILEEPSMLATFRRAGVKQVQWLHTKDRKLANDPKFVEPLSTATGIWFGGGRQWNFVDSYQNTEAHRLMHLVLERGGIIGGSSAGASIQGDFMPRGDPMGNTLMMAEGYEQGLGFLTGVAIDQHFTQRARFPDMRLLKRTHPQLLGIGIDEGTCLLVRNSKAEVLGDGQVAFFDQPARSAQLDTNTSIIAGEVYDLESRKIIKDTTAR